MTLMIPNHKQSLILFLELEIFKRSAGAKRTDKKENLLFIEMELGKAQNTVYTF